MTQRSWSNAGSLLLKCLRIKLSRNKTEADANGRSHSLLPGGLSLVELLPLPSASARNNLLSRSDALSTCNEEAGNIHHRCWKSSTNFCWDPSTGKHESHFAYLLIPVGSVGDEAEYQCLHSYSNYHPDPYALQNHRESKLQCTLWTSSSVDVNRFIGMELEVHVIEFVIVSATRS